MSDVFNVHASGKSCKLPARWGLFTSNINSEKITIFCHLNDLRQVDKLVEFRNTDPKPRVYLNNKETSFDCPTCDTKEAVENFLLEIHKLKLCPGAVLGKHGKDCKQYLDHSISSEKSRVRKGRKVNRAIRCSGCIRYRDTLLKREKRRQEREKSRPKMSLLAQRTQQNRRLKKKVSMIHNLKFVLK